LLLLHWRHFIAFVVTIARLLAAILLHPGSEVATLVSSKLTATHWLTRRPGHIGRLVALLANDHIEFNELTIAHRAHRFLGVVAGNGALVNEDILFGVVAIDEAVAALHVEPFDSAGDFGGCK